MILGCSTVLWNWVGSRGGLRCNEDAVDDAVDAAVDDDGNNDDAVDDDGNNDDGIDGSTVLWVGSRGLR